ncbi:MAG: DUF447 family protein [Gemmatales bacterium]|nr:DUF447 family protein [Gemmatales bacterium]
MSTLTPDNQLHLAPMGATILPEDLDVRGRPRANWHWLVLRPFQTAQTYRNLRHHPEGVFHLTDDVLLLAQAAIGAVEPFPEVRPAHQVLGYVVQDVCRYYEFRIVEVDDRAERALLRAEVVACGRFRDFLGFNRACHAVLEAAILATRLHILPYEQVRDELRRLQPLVEKTGGPREHAAFQLICQHITKHSRASPVDNA